MDFSLTAKYSKSYDPSTTEIPEVSQSVENSPDEKGTPEPNRNFSPSDPSLANLISDLPQSPGKGRLQVSNSASSHSKSIPRRATQSSSRSHQPFSRPHSAKQLVSSPLLSSRSVKDSVSRLSRVTSTAAVTSLYHVISERVRTSGQNSLEAEDLRDIKSYFETEQIRFEEVLGAKVGEKTLTPYEIHKREKTRMKNEETMRKHEAISDKKHQEEVQMAGKAATMLKNSLEDRLALHILRLGQRLERQRKSEASRSKREQAAQSQTEKTIIISNIRNFYHDRIELLKEQIESERSRDRLRTVEQRQVPPTQALARAETERRAQRQALLDEARSLLTTQREREQLSSLSKERLEDELIRMYKRS